MELERKGKVAGLWTKNPSGPWSGFVAPLKNFHSKELPEKD